MSQIIMVHKIDHPVIQAGDTFYKEYIANYIILLSQRFCEHIRKLV